jgi:hypothetical protein
LLHPFKGNGDDGTGGSVKLEDHIIHVMVASSFTCSRTGELPLLLVLASRLAWMMPTMCSL